MADEEVTQETPAEGTEATEAPTIEELQAKLTDTEGRNSQLVSRLDRLESLLIKQGLEEGETRQRPVPEPERKPEPADFDNMSTADAIKYVLGTIDEKLTKHTKSVDERVEQLRLQTERDRMVGEIVDAKEAHPDLLTYQQEIVQIMSNSRGLSIEEAYQLAKLRAGKGANGQASAPSGGVSLPPRGSSRPVAKVDAAPKSFEEAGRAAWKKLGMGG